MDKTLIIKSDDMNPDKDKIKDLIYLTLLYDFYGELLSGHNKQIYEDYILNDLSLSEIADYAGISRQGVHDIIKRCSKKLREYEERLHLVKKFEMTKQKVDEIKVLSNYMKTTNDYKDIDRIEQISQEILKEL